MCTVALRENCHHGVVRVGSSALGVCVLAWAVSAGCHHKPPSTAQQATGGPVAAAPADGSLDSKTRRDFDRNIAAYVSLRQRLERRLPIVARTAGTDDRQTALRGLIARARAKARPGDVFEPAMQASVRNIVRRSMEGPNGANIRASLMDENPTRTEIQVNGGYPDAVPVSSMGSALLAALPPLPDGLEFHFVGSRMVLLDTRARMIVDYIEYVLK